mmetsp:Transcript_110096/g.190954  ORF Transcript_110096/g.190954 Transcript_110096/m.190954 type:complete len:261 (+) Transcript_110096:56-838(+)
MLAPRVWDHPLSKADKHLRAHMISARQNFDSEERAYKLEAELHEAMEVAALLQKENAALRKQGRVEQRPEQQPEDTEQEAQEEPQEQEQPQRRGRWRTSSTEAPRAMCASPTDTSTDIWPAATPPTDTLCIMPPESALDLFVPTRPVSWDVRVQLTGGPYAGKEGVVMWGSEGSNTVTVRLDDGEELPFVQLSSCRLVELSSSRGLPSRVRAGRLGKPSRVRAIWRRPASSHAQHPARHLVFGTLLAMVFFLIAKLIAAL